jgi:hypothetical protein
MTSEPMTGAGPGLERTEAELRDQAVERIKARRGLQAHALAYLLVNGFLTLIWALNHGGFFWPLFPMFGWGIGLAFNAWDVYSPGTTEDRIQAEMERIRGRR